MQNRILSKLANLFLAIFSVLFTLALIEIALRVFYIPGKPLELEEVIPWDSDENSHYSPPLNQYGFREAAYGNEIFIDDLTRILLLGDSFTFGFGIEDGTKRFSDLVESRLNFVSKQTESAVHFHIYNAGMPGTEPEEWVSYLKLLQPVYQPDYVFAIFFLRDGTRLCTSLRCHEEIITAIKSKYTERFLYRYSYLARYFYDNLMHREFSDYYENQITKAYLGNEEERAFWAEQQKYLLEIRDTAIQNGAEFHLIIFPILIDLNSDYPFHKVDAEIIRFANEANIPVYAMTAGFMGQDASQLWISPNDQHPNERGHEVASDVLFPYIYEVLANP